MSWLLIDHYLAGAAPRECLGCPVQGEVDRSVVEFAITELRGGENGKCLRTVVWVDNFEEQVTSGLFTLDCDKHIDNMSRLWPGRCTSSTCCWSTGTRGRTTAPSPAWRRRGVTWRFVTKVCDHVTIVMKVWDRPWLKMKEIKSTTCSRDFA